MNLYKIRVTNFGKHNPKARPHYKYVRLSTNFFSDGKVNALPTSLQLLFINLLTICADMGCDTVTITERQVNGMLTSKLGCENALLHLQSFQLVSYEKIVPELNRIELNRVELNRTEGERKPAAARRAEKPAPPAGTKEVIAHYCEMWKKRYKANPPITGKVSGQFKKLVEEFGQEKAMAYVEAYLQMPDSWFVTKRHDITTLHQNLNAVAQFMSTGKVITRRDVQNLDLAVTNQATLDAVRNGEI